METNTAVNNYIKAETIHLHNLSLFFKMRRPMLLHFIPVRV